MKKKILNYEIMDEKYHYLNIKKLDKWEIYNYLTSFKKENKRLDLFLPSWFVNLLREINLENYQISLYDAIKYYFRVYGVDDFVDEILIIEI